MWNSDALAFCDEQTAEGLQAFISFQLYVQSSLHTLVDQRYNFGEHGRDGMPVGEQARPRGVSKRFRHLHVQRIWMLLDTLGALQKLHQEVSAGTRAEKSAGTLIYSSVSIQYEKFYG